MAKIEIANFDYVDENEVKAELDKEKYICFLVEKGLEECDELLSLFQQVDKLVQNGAVASVSFDNFSQFMLDAMYNLKNTLPNVIRGNYEDILIPQGMSEQEMRKQARQLRQQLVKKLDDKYSDSYNE